jgi:lactate racemase
MTDYQLSRIARGSDALNADDVREIVAATCPKQDYRGQRVLVTVPDATRTCPLGLVFSALFDQVGTVASAFDVMIALGTHPSMSDDAILNRLEISAEERNSKYGSVRFFNHDWNNPSALIKLGEIKAAEIEKLTNGLFATDVTVTINRRVFDYDRLIIAGPVFPHEVVGFSGGNKYLFPGVSGPEVLNFFHWLGAVITNPMIIGNKHTPVRAIVDRAAGMVSMPKLCLCMVVDKGRLKGLFAGSSEAAWEQASELSRELHIVYKDAPFRTVLSCAPPMYNELWVGGKCMYKLEPVVADGGELIIYAPHIKELSRTHGELIQRIGYHCRDYFLKQWDKFKHYPWGVLAHSTHVRGIGTYEDGVERCRIKVTLATGIPKDVCESINLGYRNPDTIRIADYSDRERDGVLAVPNSGETLFHLRNRPFWAAASDSRT